MKLMSNSFIGEVEEGLKQSDGVVLVALVTKEEFENPVVGGRQDGSGCAYIEKYSGFLKTCRQSRSGHGVYAFPSMTMRNYPGERPGIASKSA
jgi:hypothetical protein